MAPVAVSCGVPESTTRMLVRPLPVNKPLILVLPPAVGTTCGETVGPLGLVVTL